MATMELAERNRKLFIQFHDEVIVGGNVELGLEMQSERLAHGRGAIGETLALIDPEGVSALRKLSGRDRFREATKLLRTYFPEWNSELHEVWASGSHTIAKLTVKGRYNGRFLGHGTPDAPFALEQLVVTEWDDQGRQVHIYAMGDELGLWRQLGAKLPGPDQLVSFAGLPHGADSDT
jgi:SnoaL-like polyketide cyclase